MSETIKVNYKDLPETTSREFDYCRKLVREGKPRGTRVEFYREDGTPSLVIKNIDSGAALMVLDAPSRGPVFIPFRECPFL